MKVGVIGSTGYAGQQLTSLLYHHPEVEIEFLSSYTYEGEKFSDVYGMFHDILNQKCIGLEEAIKKAETIDLLFIVLPHGKSLEIIERIKSANVKIIDFGADFRMNDKETIKEWYGLDHKDEKLLSEAVYGLPELNRNKIKTARLVANPGCYPTASLLGLLPLIGKEYVDTSSIVIDAKSGVTGAGRKTTLALSYCEANENFKAYAIGSHRHTPEIEEVLSNQANQKIVLSFTPHLVPMQRGILSTIYIKLKGNLSENEIAEIYNDYYKNDYFVRMRDTLPETKLVSRTNYCDLLVHLDKRTNRLVIISAIDNLVKGSAGQAIQNMNLMMGYPETLGLKGAYYYL